MMEPDRALSVFEKLTAMYNERIGNDQKKFWVNELESLTEETAQKVIQGLKSNRLYEKTMPTIPQFLNLYKQNNVSVVVRSEHDFCYVCNNKGAGLWWIYDEYTGLPHELTWYCDYCELGKSSDNKIDHTNKHGVRRYSVPISELTDVNKLIEKNKIKKNQNKQNVQEYKKHVLRLIGMVGEIDSRDVPSKFKKSVVR